MEASSSEWCVIMTCVGVLLVRWWWYEGPQPASWCQVEGQNVIDLFHFEESLELSFAVILWYWFVNSANFVVYLKYFTNIRQKTRDYLLYTRFWVGRIAGWEGDGAPGAGAHKCLPPNLPPNQSSSGKTSVGNSMFYGSFGVTSFLECDALKPVMCQQLTEARDIEQQLQSTGS